MRTTAALAELKSVERTPGEEFAAAVRDTRARRELVVPFHTHLPAAFPLFASRPRYPVRHLLKTAPVTGTEACYVHEPPKGALGASGTSYETTPEAHFAPRLEQAELTDITATVPLPFGLLDWPELLTQYIDFRLLVRLSVVENQSLLHGTADGAITGLLNLPGTRHTGSQLGLEAAVTEAAAEVEETGGSCDGIVAHPFTYWEMVRTGLLERLQVAGITVSRTRMIARDRLLLGDFRAAFTLLLPNVAHIALRSGTEGDRLEACTRIGLAVHLPQHLMTLSWAAGR
ncbi:family 3 encapsulin nanocompartment shell protein [Amycolatopsis aidingensis]|uniref:family 3 encapsulin nanocompartment shell protein n=1 Tax=Amycolatopsis aidingensis TaxID=2842453 RepID=UPI001C0DC4ED|nr:family 3 encapsulin nanocompartment shell protein [Amycolatopsis aidingensis]